MLHWRLTGFPVALEVDEALLLSSELFLSAFLRQFTILVVFHGDAMPLDFLATMHCTVGKNEKIDHLRGVLEEMYHSPFTAAVPIFASCFCHGEDPRGQAVQCRKTLKRCA